MSRYHACMESLMERDGFVSTFWIIWNSLTLIYALIEASMKHWSFGTLFWYLDDAKINCNCDGNAYNILDLENVERKLYLVFY